MSLDALPHALLIALAVQFLSQGIKFISHSIRLRRPSWKHLVTLGGMPSAHSSFVTAVAVTVGLDSGFGSNLFSLAAVFGAIVIYDAYRLRGEVQSQARVLNRLQTRGLPEGERVTLNEMVGHSAPEIVAGIVLACAIATPLALFWR